MAKGSSTQAARLTRRGMLVSAASMATARAQLGSKAAARAFALIGDESHNSDYIRSALTSTLV
ncbi:MAG TPA: hypothetical protein VLH09_06065, partial [Bryobacteraceae bacterium]|nr:hypothetical protein [Bryobacteraceae bacterium]